LHFCGADIGDSSRLWGDRLAFEDARNALIASSLPAFAMAIPDYQTLMLPLLRLAADGEVHSARSAHDSLAAQFELTE